MSDQDFGDFTIAVTHKPVGGVTDVAIPEKLAKLLSEHAPKALADPDYELTLTAADETQAKKLSLYARAWGARQNPKLLIHKIANRRDMKSNIARLSVKLDADVPAENRPGRRPASK
jgi:hypothetical protein